MWGRMKVRMAAIMVVTPTMPDAARLLAEPADRPPA